MFSARKKLELDLGIVFVAPGETEPQTSNELPDGTVMVRVIPRVNLPSSNPDTWDESSCENAFHELAQISRPYHHLNYELAFFLLDREEFGRWVAKHGYGKPTFWGSFPKVHPVRDAAPTLPAVKPPPGRRGRKYKYDWDGAIKKKLWDALDQNGWPSADDDGEWRTQADAEKLVAELAPDTVPSTVRHHTTRLMQEWKMKKEAGK
jgi:hypothetical protein